MSPHKAHKADDGADLPVREGVILDREGKPVFGPQIVITKMPWLWAGALGLIVPFMLLAGIAVMGGLVAVGTVYWVFRTILNPNHRKN